MKKCITLITTIICILLNTNAIFANENSVIKDTRVEMIYDDGSYIETTIEQNSKLSKASTTSGSKTDTYKDSNGKILWTIKVSGTFTYTGSSATCTSVSISTTCPANNWKLSNKSASKSGSSAIATATAKQYTLLGICTNTVNRTVRLTCSANGKLS